MLFPPQDKIIASGSSDKTLRLNSDSSEFRSVEELTESVNSVSWKKTPTQLFLATGSEDRTMRIWECVKGAKSDGKIDLILRWTSAQGTLSAFKTIIEGAQISQENEYLLKQRGAIGESARSRDEITKKKRDQADVAESLGKFGIGMSDGLNLAFAFGNMSSVSLSVFTDNIIANMSNAPLPSSPAHKSESDKTNEFIEKNQRLLLYHFQMPPKIQALRAFR